MLLLFFLHISLVALLSGSIHSLMRALGSEGLLVSGVSLKLDLLNLELRAFEDPGVAGASIWIHHIVARQV